MSRFVVIGANDAPAPAPAATPSTSASAVRLLAPAAVARQGGAIDNAKLRARGWVPTEFASGLTRFVTERTERVHVVATLSGGAS